MALFIITSVCYSDPVLIESTCCPIRIEFKVLYNGSLTMTALFECHGPE